MPECQQAVHIIHRSISQSKVLFYIIYDREQIRDIVTSFFMVKIVGQ